MLKATSVLSNSIRVKAHESLLLIEVNLIRVVLML